MTKNIKIILTLLITTAIFTWGISSALALDLTGKLIGVGSAMGFTETTPNLAKTIGLIIRAFLSILGVIFLIYIVYGGYQWMMARGNEENLTKAKAIIRGSITGLIIVLAAYAITAFVVNRVTLATGYAPAAEEGAATPPATP